MSANDQEKNVPQKDNSTDQKESKPADMSYYRDSLQSPFMDEDTLLKQMTTISVPPIETENMHDDKPDAASIETDVIQNTEEDSKANVFNKFSNVILKKNRHLSSLLLFVFLSLGVGLSGSIISKSLIQAMTEADGQLVSVIVIMKEQYDSHQLYTEVKDLGRTERRTRVSEKLISFSAKTQSSLSIRIEALEKVGLVSDVRYLWISNVIGMKATAEAITLLENHPDIDRIEHDPMRQVLPAPVNNTEYHPERNIRPREHNTREIAQNVALINAPEAWAQGFTGSGVIVGVIDSGVNYNHTDLAGQLWIHPDYPNHGFNFFANNHDTSDGHGHGTHCAGTVAGNGTSGIHTGVAPESSIMILRVVDSAGNGTQQNVWNAVQFAIQNGADVISMSLGWQYAWNPDRSMWRSVMTNALSAGISSAVATGNEGNGGIRTPGDCPPPWLHPDQPLTGGYSGVVSVGATNYDDQAASFSSRGPAAWHLISPYFDYPLNPGIGLIKPDITAPGVDIVSLSGASDNVSYATMSGTSMATPAVAGVMALMYSKKPTASPEEISQYLELSALPLAPVKNNITGSGRVDALAALNNLAAHISILGYTIDGTSAGYVYAGQTFNLGISLINYGIYDIQNVQALLTTSDPYVSILNNCVNYGDIDGLETANPPYSFVLSVAPHTPHNHSVHLVLELSASGDMAWEQELCIIVQAPYLELLFPIVSDPLPGGNANGIAEADENLDLIFPIINSGGSPVQAFSIQIQSLDNLGTIESISNNEYSSLPMGEVLYPSLQLNISSQAATGDEIRFSYSIQSTYHEFSGIFSVVVGGVNTIQVGAGNLVNSPSEASPINIHYRSLRGQAVYTSAELQQAGYVSQGGALIRGMAYYVETSPIYPLPDFSIRMKHTTATNVSQHDGGPFETVFYTVAYVPTAGAWDFIIFDTPFYYNGTDNILVDTAFSQTPSFNSSGQLKITTIPIGYRFARADNANQTNAVTTNLSTNRPQIAFQMIPNPPYYGEINLSALHTGTEVALGWNTTLAGNRDLQAYAIYRNGILLHTVGTDQQTYTDSNVLPATWYYYYIQGILGDGASFNSNISSIQTQNAIPMPNIEPISQIHYSPVLITISTDTPDATIRYTIDGTEPDETSAVYTNSFTTNSYYTMVMARAFKANHFTSHVSERELFILRSPESLDVYTSPGFAGLSWQAPVYNEAVQQQTSRSNGFDPISSTTPSSTRENPLGYHLFRSDGGSPFERVNDEIITETHYDDSGLPSGEFIYYATAVYDAGESDGSNSVSVSITGILPIPHFDPAPGIYNEPIIVNIQSLVMDAEIYYTLDGSDPDLSSLQYNQSGISIGNTVLIKAIALHPNWYDSAIGTATYTIETSQTSEDISLPQKTELIKAYPNPFNPISHLRYGVSDPAHVKLDVYSLRGQLIKNLLDQRMTAGYHTIEWDGTDNGGRPVGSGVYLYRMTTNKTKQIMKILMIK